MILYRIGQEALTNVRKHASAKTATVTLADASGGYFLRVADDGIGFDPPEAAESGRDTSALRRFASVPSWPAAGYASRAAQGGGTTVEVWIPW